MGSRLARAKGERLSSQNGVAGFTESLKVTRSVWFPASMNALPVLQSTPVEGSPAPCSPAGVEPSDGWIQLGGVCVTQQPGGEGEPASGGAPRARGGGGGRAAGRRGAAVASTLTR